VRTFIIMHDCAHRSFLPSARANDAVGMITGVITMTPFSRWRSEHAKHHASSGDLERRGHGDIPTLTVREYLARTPWQRFRYRLFRHPLVLIGLGPLHMMVLQRLHPDRARLTDRASVSVWSTNAALAAVFAAFAIWLGVLEVLLIYLPAMYLAGAAGVWLFYVQHQYEGVAWARGDDWKADDAAMHGSSHYDLPPVLRWLTANIGVHHVHHAQSRVPFYRLNQVLKDHPELKALGRVTLWESFRCARLALWDEASRRLISFRELRRAPLAA